MIALDPLLSRLSPIQAVSANDLAANYRHRDEWQNALELPSLPKLQLQ
jgi:hypothetical protein